MEHQKLFTLLNETRQKKEVILHLQSEHETLSVINQT